MRRNVKRTLDQKIEQKRAEAKVRGNIDVDTDSEAEAKGWLNITKITI